LGQLPRAVWPCADVEGRAYGPLVRAQPVTAERWDDLSAVLGSSGGDGGCWDMFWRLTGSEYSASSKDRNRAMLRRVVEAGTVAPGLLAYRDGEPAGWISVGPRSGYRRLARSRHFAAMDDRMVFSVICLRVVPAHRGAGVSLALVRAAVEHAAEHGAAAVEAYPVRTDGRRLQARDVYCGTLELFSAAGFQVVRRRTGAVSGGCPRVMVRRYLT
jgi:ribosomal protein S18 acetylase RimI-like enzyme